MKKDTAIIVANVVVAVGLVVLGALGKMDWKTVLGVIGALSFPSALDAAHRKESDHAASDAPNT